MKDVAGKNLEQLVSYVLLRHVTLNKLASTSGVSCWYIVCYLLNFGWKKSEKKVNPSHGLRQSHVSPSQVIFASVVHFSLLSNSDLNYSSFYFHYKWTFIIKNNLFHFNALFHFDVNALERCYFPSIEVCLKSRSHCKLPCHDLFRTVCKVRCSLVIVLDYSRNWKIFAPGYGLLFFFFFFFFFSTLLLNWRRASWREVVLDNEERFYQGYEGTKRKQKN